ncbi:SGNH/GDSL hydrolase family protein [Rhodopirellula sp. JC639]|uniref:SGNH/GDSL hydrolase family protein n=1 Tax=Stieleria mannarensis TaxID=2755585 RepID=UPI0016010E66|nr:SGNH/GDSL hydrolase family protein [Rhodopirellula sp. JC639]
MGTKGQKRLRLILAVGVLLIIGSVFYIRFFLVRPIGSGPAGPRVDASYFTQPWTDRPVKVVGIGDSITAGLGADTPDHSFFNRLLRNPADEFDEMRNVCLSAVIPNLEFENLAVSGSTSEQHLDTIRERLIPQNPDVFGLVVITTGGNDLIHSYGRRPPEECAMYGATLDQSAPWIDRFGKRLDAILDTITARFPGGCEIYLANIYDPTDGVGDAPSIYLPHWPDGLEIHSRYNDVIAACAARRPNTHVVPLYATFLGHGSHCRQFWRSTYDSSDPTYWYFQNIEDPNDRGYDAIRRVFLNTIVKNSALVSSFDSVHGQLGG